MINILTSKLNEVTSPLPPAPSFPKDGKKYNTKINVGYPNP